MLVASLLTPILSANGSAGILRNAVNYKEGLRLLNNFSAITVATTFGIYLVVDNLPLSSGSWVVHSVLIGGGEGLLLNAVTLLRAQDKSGVYFLIGVVKFILMAALVGLAYALRLDLNSLLLFSAVIPAIVFLVLYLIIDGHRSGFVVTGFAVVIAFSLSLIPHGLSQWVIGGFNRILLEGFLGMAEVGKFSLAFNLASVLMLINMSVYMVIPTVMIKGYDDWTSRGMDEKVVAYYSGAAVVLFSGILMALWFDREFFNIVGYYGLDLFVSFVVLYLGMYCMGLYYIYSNYLFFHKKGGLISYVTLRSAVFAVLASGFFIYLFGVIGAAVSYFMSYAYYLIDIRRVAVKVDANASFPLMGTLSCFVGAYLVVAVGAGIAFNYI